MSPNKASPHPGKVWGISFYSFTLLLESWTQITWTEMSTLYYKITCMLLLTVQTVSNSDTSPVYRIYN